MKKGKYVRAGACQVLYPESIILKDTCLINLTVVIICLCKNTMLYNLNLHFQFSPVAQSCLTLCDPMNCSMPGLPVYHQLLEFTQTRVHRVGDAIQPPHPLLSPSPPAPNPSQHRSFPMSQLFASGGQSTAVSTSASGLPVNTQDWSP